MCAWTHLRSRGFYHRSSPLSSYILGSAIRGSVIRGSAGRDALSAGAFTVAASAVVLAAGLALSPSRVLAAGPAWYAGDLHSHSTYSDGDSPVADLVAEAERVGLDFYVLTDHDSSMGGETPHWFDPDYVSDKLILLYGVEWTNRNGHANVWAAAPFDYRPLWTANLMSDPWAAAQSAHSQGALFSINHPTNYACCPWVPGEGMNDAVEVWNSFHRTATWDYGATHYYWEAALMDGQAITAVGGSDLHYLTPNPVRIFTIGNPTTWVYADTPTASGILAGIKASRVSVSYGPDAPRVELWADADDNGSYETVMGGTMPEGPGSLEIRLGENFTQAMLPSNPEPSAVPLTPRALAQKRAQQAILPPSVKPVPLSVAQSFFSNDMSPATIARLEQVLQPSACGPTYLVGLYEAGNLISSSKVACGARWHVQVNAQLYSFYRVEVLGAVKASPGTHAAYGSYVALSNPIRVE